MMKIEDIAPQDWYYLLSTDGRKNVKSIAEELGVDESSVIEFLLSRIKD